MHNFRNKSKQSYKLHEENSCIDILEDVWKDIKSFADSSATSFFKHPETIATKHVPQKYAYIFRKKSIWELILLSLGVCGVEFCLAAEAAFVTPLLLSLRMEMRYATMIWCLSPLISLFLTPILGSMSDVCSSKLGRRRPFIIGLSACILIGFFLVPFGKQLGLTLGDVQFSDSVISNNSIDVNDFEGVFKENNHQSQIAADFDALNVHEANIFSKDSTAIPNEDVFFDGTSNEKTTFQTPPFTKYIVENIIAPTENCTQNITTNTSLTRSIIFTVLGTILIDSCCDILLSPCRAYMLDVTLPIDHAKGNSIFSLMSGVGAGLAMVVGAVEWRVPVFGNSLEGQVIVVFVIIGAIFVVCMALSVCFLPEIPVSILKDPECQKEYRKRYSDGSEQRDIKVKDVGGIPKASTAVVQVDAFAEENGDDPMVVVAAKGTEEELPSSSGDIPLIRHLKSIIRMPKSLFCLCLVNLFTWMTANNYFLYFTNFMGEYVYGGSPHAHQNSAEYILYKDGLRYGCWGRAISSVFIVFYSISIEWFIKHFGLKCVYIGGHIACSIGFIIMIVSKNNIAAIILSSVTGVVYGTAFTVPYLLVSQYHSNGMEKYSSRGLGTDVAVVTSMAGLSQFILSLTIGSITEAIGSSAVPIGASATAGACGALAAFFVTYPATEMTAK